MSRLWPLLFLPALAIPELPLDPFQGGLGASLHHWLGTDALGRDALLRLLVAASRATGFASLCGMTALAMAWGMSQVGSQGQQVLSALRALPPLLWLIPLAWVVGGLPLPLLALLLAGLLAPHLEAPLRLKTECLRRSPAWAMGRVQGASPLWRIRTWAPWAAQESIALFPSAWLGALWAEVTLSALGLGPGPQQDTLGRLLMEQLPRLSLGAPLAWAALGMVLALAWSLTPPETSP